MLFLHPLAGEEKVKEFTQGFHLSVEPETQLT